MRYRNGDVYTGGWNYLGRQHGEGTIEYATGGYYDGGWKNGEPTAGHADVTLPIGRYDGAWAAGRPQGSGRMEYSDGGVCCGAWTRKRS
jgi:hypothetical protein